MAIVRKPSTIFRKTCFSSDCGQEGDVPARLMFPLRTRVRVCVLELLVGCAPLDGPTLPILMVFNKEEFYMCELYRVSLGFPLIKPMRDFAVHPID